MRYRWSALTLVLALVLMPRVGRAQSQAAAPKTEVRQRQNYPNPFNPETWGTFSIDGAACGAGGGSHRVSVRIYNILMQVVAVPQLQGGSGGVAGGQPFEKILLPCGQYTWYWNGFYGPTGKEAPSGVYIVLVDVDGRKSAPVKMTIKK